MIIFLYGSDGYRLKESADTIVDAYYKKHQSGLSYHRFNFDQTDEFGDLANAVNSVSFFDEAKLVIVKNLLYSGQTTIKQLKALVDDFQIGEDRKTVLVFVENKASKELQKINKEIFNILSSKNNLVKEVEPLTRVKLYNWVKNKFKENGHNVSPAVVSLLINVAGNESWALANEIEKLCNYKVGGTISERDVNSLVSHQDESSIFDLVDAVGNLNKAEAFETAYKLLNAGHDGYYLLSMLTYHFENLISVADALNGNKSLSASEVAKKCNLHPFVAKKAISQSQRFTREELIKKFNHLAGLDVKSKNGVVNLEDSLYNFFVS